MKIMLTGIFLAVSSMPMAFLAGRWVYQHSLGGLPRMLSSGLEVASYVAGGTLLLAVFVFVSGLRGGESKVHSPQEGA